MKKQYSFKNLLEIQKEIQDVLDAFDRRVDDQYFMENLIRTEYFFNDWIDNPQLIKRSMKTISKIKCLHFKSKNIIWYNFYEDNKYFLETKIQNQVINRRDKGINKIIVKKYSQ